MTNVSAPLGLDMFYLYNVSIIQQGGGWTFILETRLHFLFEVLNLRLTQTTEASCGIWSQPVWVTGDITPVSTEQQTIGRLWQNEGLLLHSHILKKSFSSWFHFTHTDFSPLLSFSFTRLFPQLHFPSLHPFVPSSMHQQYYPWISPLFSSISFLFLHSHFPHLWFRPNIFILSCPLSIGYSYLWFPLSFITCIFCLCFLGLYISSLSFMLFQSEQNDNLLPFTVSLSPFLTVTLISSFSSRLASGCGLAVIGFCAPLTLNTQKLVSSV